MLTTYLASTRKSSKLWMRYCKTNRNVRLIRCVKGWRIVAVTRRRSKLYDRSNSQKFSRLNSRSSSRLETTRLPVVTWPLRFNLKNRKRRSTDALKRPRWCRDYVRSSATRARSSSNVTWLISRSSTHSSEEVSSQTGRRASRHQRMKKTCLFWASPRRIWWTKLT